MTTTAALLAALAAGMVAMVAAAAPAPKIVIAHRGASGYLPEHTLAAKAMAHAQGADYLEQDVVLSKDDVPMVLHDIHIDTVTDVARRFPDRKRADGRYYALDFTAGELKQLAASERFDPRTGPRFSPGALPWQGSFRPRPSRMSFTHPGLNRSTGRNGRVPQTSSRRGPTQGRDIIPIVLDLLGVLPIQDNSQVLCPCFDDAEVRASARARYKGRLVRSSREPPLAGEHARLRTPAGLAELPVPTGGPALSDVVSRRGGGMEPQPRS